MSTSPSKLFGFTLLELLVVMAIIGILAAIGIASYGTVQSKARDARRKSDLENVARALEMYRNDMGSYPAGGAGNGNFQFSSATVDNSFVHGTSTDVVYMQKTPKETKGGYGYYYQVINVGSGTNNGYQLFARLENREDGAILPGPGGDPGIYPVPDLLTAASTCGSGCNYRIGSTNAPAMLAIDEP